jgi:EAL domain-containing protein (putative c-di-GMP-specific phosphodiesterase class I)
VASIEPQWLEELGAHLLKRHRDNPHWEKSRAQVVALERGTLYGLPVYANRRVHFGPHDPGLARDIFIRSALVEGDYETRAPFFAHNRRLLAEIERLEHKSRRPDILVDDELIYAFYDARVPEGIHNGADFDKWRKDAEREDPRLLFLAREDLMRHEAAGITTENFPHELRLGANVLRLDYHFDPRSPRDGVTLTGYEALARWQHPTRGAIAPSEFIPVAEETGLIEPLGRQLLRRACLEAATWPEPLTVAVNLSPAQFRNDGIVRTVVDALGDSGLAPRRLELEITESLLMVDTERVVRVLQALSSLGVSIGMEDFGTGYSSLAYLWRFPFDKVKIDRAFTKGLAEDPKVNLIVRSIVSLAHALQIRVNAEGVETDGQLRALQKHGCDELQGFLLGRPAEIESYRCLTDGADSGAEQSTVISLATKTASARSS